MSPGRERGRAGRPHGAGRRRPPLRPPSCTRCPLGCEPRGDGGCGRPGRAEGAAPGPRGPGAGCPGSARRAAQPAFPGRPPAPGTWRGGSRLSGCGLRSDQARRWRHRRQAPGQLERPPRVRGPGPSPARLPRRSLPGPGQGRRRGRSRGHPRPPKPAGSARPRAVPPTHCGSAGPACGARAPSPPALRRRAASPPAAQSGRAPPAPSATPSAGLTPGGPRHPREPRSARPEAPCAAGKRLHSKGRGWGATGGRESRSGGRRREGERMASGKGGERGRGRPGRRKRREGVSAPGLGPLLRSVEQVPQQPEDSSLHHPSPPPPGRCSSRGWLPDQRHEGSGPPQKPRLA